METPRVISSIYDIDTSISNTFYSICVFRCDPELQDLCYKHIVLSGGTTLLKGFTSRLQHELHLINHRIRKIRTPEHRKHSPWIGGSILASLPSFDEQYVTVDDYSENGSQIIQKKCF